MATNSFHEYVKELFVGVGPVQIKRMFGGAGGYADGVMFLLLGNDTIHIKVDDALKIELLDLGYWRLPEHALDDPDEAAVWGRKALKIAKAKAAAKPPKKAKAAPKNANKPSPKKTAKR